MKLQQLSSADNTQMSTTLLAEQLKEPTCQQHTWFFLFVPVSESLSVDRYPEPSSRTPDCA